MSRYLRRTAIAVVVGLILSLALPLSANAAVPTPPAAPPASGKAQIFGVVSIDAGGPWSGTLAVYLRTSFNNYRLADYDPATGYFEFAGNIDPGSYRLVFDYTGSGGWADSAWAPPAGQEGDFFSLVAGQTLEANGALHLGGAVSGTLTVPPLTGLVTPKVTLDNQSGGPDAEVSADPSTGAFSVIGVQPGNYKVFAWDIGSPILAQTNYVGSGPDGTLVVTYGSVASATNILLKTVVGITGIVSYELEGGGTAPAANVAVSFFNNNYHTGGGSYTVHTDENGRYLLSSKLSNALNGPVVGLWFESADPGLDLVKEWWNDTTVSEEQTLLSFGVDEYKTGYDAVLAPAGSVSGHVVTEDGPAPNISVRAFDLDDLDRDAPAQVETNAQGEYVIHNLPPGRWAIRAVDYFGSLGTSYPGGVHIRGDSTPIVVDAREHVDVEDIVMSQHEVDVQRISGPDRFATGVEVSKELFADGDDVPVVYIANGLNYPDALGAGPAAIHQGGGLLLVRPDSIPAVVAAELDRLDPEQIVVVGSEASVNEDVYDDLAEYATHITRLAGASRYETSREIVRYAFGDGADAIVVATGQNYPDALAAGPAAGFRDAPVILVDGSAESVPAATMNLISDLGPSRGWVLGGTNTVSASIEAQLRTVVYQQPPEGLARLAGTSRFETATMITSNIMFGDIEMVYLATGLGFADALAGGALAGAAGAPMFLSQPDCVPLQTLSTLDNLRVERVVLLGGEGSLSENVEDLKPCL